MKHQNKLLQYQLFNEALSEYSISVEFDINHQSGTNTVNQYTVGLKYPQSVISNCKLLNQHKIYDYCFVGAFMAKSNGVDRQQLLSKFVGPKSKIVNTIAGRKRKNKTLFDSEYYQTIANSKFSLCPNHSGEWYTHDDAWSYRVIETLFAKSIPIMFKDTPFGKNFLKDIFFLWDDNVHNISDAEYQHIVEDNYQKAIKYWTLQPDEIENIKRETQNAVQLQRR